MILVAHDEAFNFTYRVNIDALRATDEVRFFSPLHDDIPIDCDLLYLPGGYPELFTNEISANKIMCQQIKDYAEHGGRIFAECGGFMYLCREIDGIQMCDVLPFSATMKNAHLHLGYRQMEHNGKIYKGHEFHYSDIIECTHPDVARICVQHSAKGTPVSTPIYKYKNVTAGYTHWYFADGNLPFLNK